MNSSENNMDNGNELNSNELNSNREENQAESPRGANAQVTAEQLINWIKSRRSIGNLSIPAPTESQIRAAIDCAVTAPDHKKLRPWRFIVTQGNARHDLGRAFLAAAEAQAAQEGEELSEKSRKKTYNMPLRAPVIITVVTHMQVHKKVPPFEQMLSAGAAVQNLILALQAQGFSTVWRTGLLANEPAVKAYFDVGADDYVTAFVYTGSSPCDMPTRKPIDIEPLLRFES
ncbi:nitroreductase family protein [Psychrobacter faecalis]|jgi:nitroreductase|uniref:nitroreductase family protein n=1 Tax=Psychrobacter faecalis TaxID=180588 RepID=UPI003FD61A25